MNTGSWRSTYKELCEAIFRELGFDPPAMLHDDSLPLAMEIEIEGRSFELLHSSVDRPHQILIQCKLDNSAAGISRSEITAMLAQNLVNIRRFYPYYGINSDTQEVVSISFSPLADLTATRLIEKLRTIAQDALGWRDQLAADQTDLSDIKTEPQGIILA